MPDEFAEFATDFGCTESSDSVITEEVTLTSWAGCDDGIEMGFYAIDGGGHTWPGSPASAAIPSLGVTNFDIDATALAWEFFERHSLTNA
jgi:polyhydroxybutyrate depolymerase